MTPVLSLLSDLERRGVSISVRGDRLRLEAAAGALAPELVAEVRRHKPELIAALSLPPGPLRALQERIGRAASWEDLPAVLADAQVCYVNGELTGEEVEGLATVCAQEAQALPEVAPAEPAEVRRYAQNPLPSPDRPCHACGQSRWWRKEGGQRICAVCHPPPKREAVP